MHLIFIGLPGAGKTTLGKFISSKLSINYIDTDESIENEYGPIEDIFIYESEKYFRSIERKIIINSILHSESSIISFGGGSLISISDILNILLDVFVIYLNVPLHTIKKRLKLSAVRRPTILTDLDLLLYKMYREREYLYRCSSDIIIDGDMNLNDIISYDLLIKLKRILNMKNDNYSG